MSSSLEPSGSHGHSRFSLGRGYNYNMGQLENQAGNNVLSSDLTPASATENRENMSLGTPGRLIGSMSLTPPGRLIGSTSASGSSLGARDGTSRLRL